MLKNNPAEVNIKIIFLLSLVKEILFFWKKGGLSWEKQ